MLRQLTVKRKLQWVAGLLLLTVLTLAGSAVYFARQTKIAAHLLMENGIVGTDLANHLDVLLQQHKGLVGNAPADLDRAHLTATRTALLTVQRKIEAEVAHGQAVLGVQGASWKILAKQLESEMPALFEKGERVLDLAYDFVQDQALATAQGPYATVSDLAMAQLRNWRDAQRQTVAAQVDRLFASSDTMVLWVYGGVAATLIVGFLGFATAAGVLQRLGRIQHVMLRLADRDLDVEIPYQSALDEIGSMARAVEVFKLDALRVLAQQIELQRTNLQFEAALSNMSQGLCLFDRLGQLDIFNEQYCTILGIDRNRLRVGLSYREVLQTSLDAGNHPGRTIGEFFAEQQAFVDRLEPGVSLLEVNAGRIVAISHRPMLQGGWVATYEDVTARQAAEAKVNYMARHDTLTTLVNRLVLNEQLNTALAEADDGNGSAILCLDLDHFKAVNDTLGHPVGDALLLAVSKRLLGCVRDGDTVARLDGDEFAIIQRGLDRPEDAKSLAERIIGVVASPFVIDGQQIVIGVSVGLALMPSDGNTPTLLLKNADTALYRAKSDGRGTFCFFEPDMDARLQHRRKLEVDLRKGVLAEEFELFYQPLVSLKDDTVSGFEALLRWRHPEHGMVSPAEFIPIAEDLGVIVSLGEWVIRRACADAVKWPRGTKVSVNLSPAQFQSTNLVSTVKQSLAESGLPARMLDLEITESLLLQNDAGTLAVLHELRALGTRISMDDFGTGYSSLSYLRSFPFDKIKIDQSFIRNLSTSDGSIHIIRAVRGLCSGLGMMMTAEGVETEEQLAILRSEGCMEIQGYLFSLPQPVTEVPAIIRRISQRQRGVPAPGHFALAPS